MSREFLNSFPPEMAYKATIPSSQAWSSLGHTLNAEATCVFSDGQETYVGGFFSDRIAKYDGTSWTFIGANAFFSSPSYINSSIEAVTVDSNKNVYAAVYNSFGGPTLGVWKYDQNNWTSIYNNAVFDLISGSDGIYAAGQWGSFGGSFIGRWDGIQWNNMVGGIASPIYSFSSCSSGLYMAGEFGRLYKWDGVSLTQISTGTSINLQCVLAKSDNEIYIGGPGFRKYDGTSWSVIDGWSTNLIQSCSLGVVYSFQGPAYAGYVKIFNGSGTQIFGSFNGNMIGSSAKAPDGEIHIIGQFTSPTEGSYYRRFKITPERKVETTYPFVLGTKTAPLKTGIPYKVEQGI